MRRKVISIILLLTIFFSIPTKWKATTLGDLYDELEELKQEKANQDSQKQLSEEEYKQTSSEIMTTEQNIETLNNRIQEATEKIAELESDIAKKEEETKKILVFLQVTNGEKSYLEYIFKAKSFTDFIHRISVVEQLSKYNSNLIDEMHSLIKQNNELKEQLKNDIKTEESEREKLKEKLAELGSRIDELDDEVISIDAKISTQESLISFYEEMGCTDRSDNLSSCGDTVPTATGFLRPINKGIITSEFGYRSDPFSGSLSYHSGLDISDSSPAEGKDVYPVAPGIVSTIQRWSCGGNVIFIYHNINGVKYTSVYMHLLDTADTQVGDVVTTNQVIAHMGGYSTSTSHGGYDYCTTGAHLHLSICSGHVTAGAYRSSLIDPRNVIYFPSGWFYGRDW